MAGFLSRIFNKITGRTELDWEELEAALVASDLGVKLSLDTVAKLKKSKAQSNEELHAEAATLLCELLPEQVSFPEAKAGSTRVILVVGVNGTGKTTSSAKLAKLLRSQGHSVLLAAADTFRAAAVEQLNFWAQSLDIPVYNGKPNQDPSSVCYEAHAKALKEGYDFLICDTAGRLHTRHNLMEELGKIKRTLAKQDDTAPHYTLLVVDATTGANAYNQAATFHKATALDGLVITKLDGSGRGGIVISIYHQLGIAPVYIGTGEGADDFKPFNKQQFSQDLVK